MSYQVLARKYRPQNFADVVGQNHVTRTLLNALAQDRIAHGYIFSGHRGIGKTTIARILAMALNCRNVIGSTERPTPEPCGTCVACTEIRAGNAVDVIEIDAATNRGIDEIRELREAARYSPARDRYKIYILDEAHQITDAAFNALLKTLEEPPAHVVFMMATTQPEDIPQTIRSRCQHFSFHAVQFQVILQQLRMIATREQIAAEDEALALLAEAGDGSIRDALSIMDQAIASAAYDGGQPRLEAAQIRQLMGAVSNTIFEQMLTAVKEQNSASMLQQAGSLLDAGNAPQQIARQFVRFLRNCLMARIAGDSSDLLQVSEEERARAGRVAAEFSEEDLTRFLNTMLRAFDDLGYRQEQRFHLELGLLKLVYTQRLLPLDDILRRLSSGPNTLPAPVSQGALKNTAAGNRLNTPTSLVPPVTPKTASIPVPAPVASPKLSTANVETSAARNVSEMDASPFSSHATGTAQPPVPKVVASPVMLDATSATQETPPPVSPEVLSGFIEPSDAETLCADAETLCTAICSEMANGGHQTASSLLEGGTWQWNGKELTVQAAASKVMLEMAYNPEAQRIARESFRKLVGPGYNLSVTPERRAPGTAPTAQPKVAPKSASATVEHPLVRRAQDLFHAEIRSVVNLRERS